MPFCENRHVGAALVAAMLATGCAHEEPARVTMGELNRTVASLRAQNAAYERQIQELENRAFILGDQIDGRRAAAEPVSGNPAPPVPLPKVTLHPADKGNAAATPAEPPDEPADGVEYAGDAARTSTKRPLLRLYGDETPVFSTRDRDEPARPAPRRLTVASEGSARAERPAPRAATSALVERDPARAEPRPAPAGPGELYRRSLESLRGGHHAEAEAGFREFLRLFANHDFADNAQYWLAECYYDQKDYPTAVREFRRVMEKYPQGNKVPDALLKLSFCHLALGSTEVAKQTLEQLVHSYPGHGAATLATAKLTELGGEAQR
jgi:tol-pal system protein YbgF